jgi:hypothetical protein
VSSARHELHEAALQEVLAVDGDAAAAFEASSLSACPACRRLAAEHLALAGELDALGSEELAAVRAALAAPAPASGAAEETLRTLALRRGARRRRQAWALALAAAVALAGLALWRGRVEEPVTRGPTLGTETELLHPLREVASFAPFRWSDPGPGPGWYRVVVYPLLPDGGEAAPSESGALRETSWTPDPAETARWGAEIRWILEVHGGAGEGDLICSVGAWARLSR